MPSLPADIDGPALLEADGALKEGAWADGVHPGPEGYVIWANEIEDDINSLMDLAE
tara:strand:- start:220189 stop:220356 length:168 start_codon:yes stop_codon:yes gene_type:complete